MSDDRQGNEYRAVLKVVGIGGAGINAVNAMVKAGFEEVEFISVSLSRHRLRASRAQSRLLIGSDPLGLSTGGDPRVASGAVAQHREVLAGQLRSADMVFVVAGLGSGTGTGATPMIAQIARESGALVVGVVTLPFRHEGKRRMGTALAGLEELKRHTDSLIVVPNEQLVAIAGKGMPLQQAFRPADEILRQAVQGIAELITVHGQINVDFNDVRTVMAERGYAIIGIGAASGERRAAEACARAVRTPLMLEADLKGARGLLINISAGSDMTMDEFDAVSKFFHEQADSDADIIIGLVIDDDMETELKVTAIATGLPGNLASDSRSLADGGYHVGSR